MTTWRKILIISGGASPAVVTETVWKLFQRDPPFVPDAIHLVMTSHAESLCQRRGLLGADGKLAELFRAFGHTYIEPQIDIPLYTSGPQEGQKTPDIRDETENILYGNLITRLVKTYAGQDDTQIHMSLAGGRKIMSWYAGAAMSLFGRAQDELSHVLVKSPSGRPELIEFAKDFWWPGQPVNPVHFENRQTGEVIEVPIDGVDIDMPLIAFVRLFPTFGDDVMKLFPGGEIDLAKVVTALQELLDGRNVILVRKTRNLIAGKHVVHFEHQDFAFYLLLAEAQKEQWKGCDLQGIGLSHAGWVRFEDLLRQGPILRRFEEIYRQLLTLNELDPDDASKKVFDFVQWRILNNVRDGEGQLARNVISEMRNGCKAAINTALADNPGLAERLLIRDVKSGRAVDRFGLTLTPSEIVIVDE